jgi:hypothetical protein
MKIHEACNALPELDAQELSTLEASIKQHGQEDTIKLYGGAILDGRHRWAICQKLGIEPKLEHLQDEIDPWAYVWQHQTGRRNDDKGRRAAVWKLHFEHRIAEWKKEHAERKSVALSGNQNASKKNDGGISTTIEKPPKPKTRDKAAEAADVSPSTMKQVEQLEKLDPAALRDVADGKAKLGRALKAAQIQRAQESIQQQVRTDTKDNPPTASLEDERDFAERYKPQSIDLLLTDPPYSTDIDNVGLFANDWLPRYLDLVKPDGSAYVFIGAYPEELRAYLNVETPAHIRLVQVLVWTYRNTLGQNPKTRYKQNWQAILYYRGAEAGVLDCPATSEQWAVQDISAPDGRQGDRYHAWQKPEELCERLIRHSTKPGDIVIDPFVCTGTTIISASRLGRVGAGCDNDADALEIARRRGCIITGL